MAENAPAFDAGTSPADTANLAPPPPTEAHTRTATAARRKPRLTGKARIEAAIAEHAARLAADAPPLSPEQRRRIAELFAYTPTPIKHRTPQKGVAPDTRSGATPYLFFTRNLLRDNRVIPQRRAASPSCGGA
jgi:hypothetical protein